MGRKGSLYAGHEGRLALYSSFVISISSAVERRLAEGHVESEQDVEANH